LLERAEQGLERRLAAGVGRAQLVRDGGDGRDLGLGPIREQLVGVDVDRHALGPAGRTQLAVDADGRSAAVAGDRQRRRATLAVSRPRTIRTIACAALHLRPLALA